LIKNLNRAIAQVTTDGFAPYKTAVPDTLGDCEAYAMLIKVYGNATGDEHRYSPPEVTETEVVPVMGNPDPDRICTSIATKHYRITLRGVYGRQFCSFFLHV
jgi:hypothetical protein